MMRAALEDLKQAVRDIPDFPKPGIVFKDITPILRSGVLFRQATDAWVEQLQGRAPDLIAAVESRGFIFGAALADRLRCGFVPIRKRGKLPFTTASASYALEYGTDQVEIHTDAVSKGQTVLLIDDVLATGGTCAAALQLVERLGGKIIGVYFLIELTFLNGRQKLQNRPLFSLIQY